MSMTEPFATETLLSELKDVIANAEAVLQLSAADASDQAQSLRTQMNEHIHRAKIDLKQLQEAAASRIREAADGADAFVKQHPWKTAGVAAGLGLILGLLMSRR